MDPQINDLCQQIHTILCPEYFEQSTIESFRSQVKRCIQSTVDLSSSWPSSSSIHTNANSSIFYDDDDECSTDDNVISHYKTQVFDTVLFYPKKRHQGNVIGSNKNPGLQWGPLCKSHDLSKRTSCANAKCLSTTSTLEILLEILLNSSIVPYCFASTMIQGLFEVCVEVFSSFATSSMNLSIRPDQNRPSSLKTLQCAIQSLLQRCPCAMVSKSIGSYLYQKVMDNLSVKLPFEKNEEEENHVENILNAALEAYSIERSLTALTVASDLVSMKKIRTPQGKEILIQYSLCRSVLHQSILSVSKEMDAMDIYLLECHALRRESASNDLCKACQSTICSTNQEKKRKRIKTSSLSCLHGETSDDDQNMLVDYGTSKYKNYDRRSKDELTMFSWKRMIKEQNISSHSQIRPDSCYICSRQKNHRTSLGKISALPLRLVEFRAILYQMFIDSQMSSMLQMDTDKTHHSIRSIFQMALRYPMSASCRLCAILAADSAGLEEGYITYTKFLLSIIKRKITCDAGRRKVIDAIHIYRELLEVCAVFDDPLLCWRTLIPLMDTALNLHEDHQHSDHQHSDRDVAQMNNGIDDIETNQVVIELLKSIGAILAGKGSLIQNIIRCKEHHLAFNQYVVLFSEAFGEIKFWIDGRMPTIEQRRVIMCLQKLGILSFFDEDRVTNEEVQQREGYWLYSPLYSVRAAHVRMGPKVGSSRNLFSEISHQDECTLVKKRKFRSRDDCICDEPLMDYINDDLLRIIFSFLDYKVIVQATRVCKSWNAIGNEKGIWQGLYERRFKPIYLESLLPDAIESTIKQAFKAKHSSRNDENWKQLLIRTKDRGEFLGCKVSCGGWRHRYCRVFGCNVVLKKKDDEIRHMKVHERDVIKKVSVIERAEARRLIKQEKAKPHTNKKTSPAVSSRQTAKV